MLSEALSHLESYWVRSTAHKFCQLSLLPKKNLKECEVAITFTEPPSGYLEDNPVHEKIADFCLMLTTKSARVSGCSRTYASMLEDGMLARKSLVNMYAVRDALGRHLVSEEGYHSVHDVHGWGNIEKAVWTCDLGGTRKRDIQFWTARTLEDSMRPLEEWQAEMRCSSSIQGKSPVQQHSAALV